MTKEEKELLAEVMWDINFDTLDLKKHRKFIIERILQFGRPEQLKWLFKNYTEQDIIDTVKRSRNINRRTANLWAIHYNILTEEIKCFQKPLAPNNPFY